MKNNEFLQVNLALQAASGFWQENVSAALRSAVKINKDAIYHSFIYVGPIVLN
jgi:hypothetical protein